jgi:hypothetical protein
MTFSLQRNTRFDTSTHRLLLAVTDPELLHARVKPGTSAGTSVREVSREGTRLVQELVSQDYARTKTGGLDQSRIEPSVTRYVWDLESRRCVWHWSGQQPDRVRLSGTIDIRPLGTASELCARFEMEVKIPIVGRMIERIMAAEIEGDLPRYEAWVKRAVLGP